MNVLRWLRVPGDTLFAIGALILGWFVLGLETGWSLRKTGNTVPEGSPRVIRRGEKPGEARQPVKES
jgi:nitric oxide reductase subunit B